MQFNRFSSILAVAVLAAAALAGISHESSAGMSAGTAATSRRATRLGGGTDSQSAAPRIVGAHFLYNGIRLPAVWPPQVAALTREPQPVPYLESPPRVINIDVGRQLFVDDFLIERTTFRRTFHQPVPYEGNPILKSDRPWELGSGGPMAAPFSDGVWYDSNDRTFKMWYLCSQHKADAGIVDGFFTCYANSSDGLHWKKPLLDVVPGTNIVLAAGRDSTVVWLDSRETDPSRRFKLFRSHPDAAGRWGVSLHYSSDGIHWSKPAASSHGPKWIGDRTTVFFNPFRNVWVYSIRNRQAYQDLGRIRYYSESADPAAGLTAWQPNLWTGADRLDLRNPQFPEIEPQLYNLDATAYESVLVGLFSVWEGPENNICKARHIQKRNQVMLGYSRDGFHWERPDRRPFLAVNETEGAWNWGNMQSAGGGCIVVGDRLYFYSSGRRRNDDAWDADSSTGLFFLRRDGFASLDAGDQQGALTTRPVSFTGKQLFVNFDGKGGSLRVEILDAAGHPVAPFTAANSIPVATDSTRQPITWKGGGDLSALAGRHVRFRFLMARGSLYSFWVSLDGSGASRGYVAAGGPGFASDRDTAAAAENTPFFAQTDLFRQGDAGVHSYRIPALIETKKGTLIAVADARQDSAHDLPGRISLVMRRSFDGGQTWSPTSTIVKAPKGGVGDASLLLDRDTGRVWCFHGYGPPGIGFFESKSGERTGPNTLQWHAVYSDDDGATWSEPTDLTPQVKDPEWQGLFATSGTDTQTRSGRFLVPMVVRDGQGTICSRNAYSDDHGRTWKIGQPAEPGTDESHNVELANGVILQNMRNGKTRAVARSNDGGVTLRNTQHDPALIDPGCNAGIARYTRDGKDLIIFTNAASTRRENLTVKLSYDGGHTWPVARTIQAGPAAYSTVIPLRDGNIGMLYERGEKNAAERITFARFNLEWVTGSPQ